LANAFILLSHERSGSHFVGEFLRMLADFRVFDEVCNADALKPTKAAESFYRFKYDAIVRDPKYLLEPTPKAHRDFVTSYFEHLLSLSAPRNVVADIKYGHVQNFEYWWWPILERPMLMKICESAKIGIVHLYRENVVEATVSAMVAEKRKVWHSWQARGDASAVGPYTLPVKEIVRRARLLQRQTAWFKDWTKKNSTIELTYEGVAADLGKGGPLESALAAFLHTKSGKAFNPRVQKLTPPLHEVVKNFDELKAACRRSALAQFV